MNTQGGSGIIYALNMILLAGEATNFGSSSQTPAIIATQFWKEKEPGVFHMQVDTVMLNPGSTSEIRLALKNLRVDEHFRYVEHCRNS